MHDELPVYDVEEISLEEAVAILAGDDNINMESVARVCQPTY